MKENTEPVVSHMKGRVLKLKIGETLPGCEGCSTLPLLFEPRKDELASLGLNCEESFVAVENEGCVLVPVENYEGSSVSSEERYDMGTVKCVEPFGSGL